MIHRWKESPAFVNTVMNLLVLQKQNLLAGLIQLTGERRPRAVQLVGLPIACVEVPREIAEYLRMAFIWSEILTRNLQKLNQIPRR